MAAWPLYSRRLHFTPVLMTAQSLYTGICQSLVPYAAFTPVLMMAQPLYTCVCDGFLHFTRQHCPFAPALLIVGQLHTCTLHLHFTPARVAARPTYI